MGDSGVVFGIGSHDIRQSFLIDFSILSIQLAARRRFAALIGAP